MASFEQNQQDQFNMNNSLDQVKQFQAELDRAKSSIGAAEMVAEEEQLEVKLKNLSKVQQAKLDQLSKILELEEKGIQELAKLKLTLSEQQFEVRKKEIQKELQLYKEAADELFKYKSKRNYSKKPTNTPENVSSTKDITASTKAKPSNANIKGTDQAALTEITGVLREISNEIATSAEAPKERQFSDNHNGLEKVDLGKEAFKDVVDKFDELREAFKKRGKDAHGGSDVRKILDKVTAKGGENSSQTSIDLAGKLLDSFESTEEAIKKVREFNENQSQNKRLLTLAEEQKLRAEHENTAFANITAEISALAKQNDLIYHKDLYRAEALNKLGIDHITKENSLRVSLINAEAKARDLIQNKELYALEARLAREQAFYDEQNRLAEERIKAEAELEFTKSNKSKLLDQEEHKLRNAHIVAENNAIQANIQARAKAEDLEHNKRLYLLEEVRALNTALIEEQNKLTKEGYKIQAGIAHINANKKKYLDLEEHKLRIAHAEAYKKALLDSVAADAKAKDLAVNRNKYFNEEVRALELGHKTEQNRLIEGIIKAEAKAKDLEHNKELYRIEERAALEKAFAEESNKLAEELLRVRERIEYANTHKKELREQALLKLRTEHASAYHKYLLDNIAEEAKAEDLIRNKRKYYSQELHNLELNYKKEQNKLTEEGIKASAELAYVTKNAEKLQAQELHKLQNEHIQTEVKLRKENIAALAKATDLEKNRNKYLEEATLKLKNEHINKQNDLNEAAVYNEAKSKDLDINRDQYELEVRLALENELAEKRNSLTEDLIKKEETLKFTAAHRDELLANQRQERENKYLEEYNEHLLAAGEYAVSLEEYKTNQEKKRTNQAKKEAVDGIVNGLKKFGTGEFSLTDVKESYKDYMGKRTADLEAGGMDKASAKFRANMELATQAINNLMQALDANVRKIADMQGFVDTRLQGSIANEQKGNSYWKQLVKDAKNIAGASPFIKQEKLVDNIKVLVDKGISFDIKQRAFLMTIQEKIANTFDVADGTLLRLIRIQQQDTTAGRLGMESALNSFLNSMYETSEYLESVADNVRDSLEEMQALMGSAAATEVEYQVQKWMGSLYSVGMSDSAVQGIAQAFGQIASGDINGLTGNGAGNLLIMAANEAGKSISDILQSGLGAKETNELMQAMVNYLAEIAESSSDSRVVQQQLANVYGIKASDLRAATNLATSVKDVAKQDLTYSGMLGQLEKMMNTISQRTSISEGMTNMWDNVMYSMASTQASNPILYALPKMSNLLKDVTGGNGIALPFLNVMGFGVELNTSVAELMMVASMAGTALGALGPLISGIADLATGGKGMLSRAGIDTKGGKIPVLARGTASPLQNMGGSGLSESGMVGNSSGEDIKNATLQDAEDDKKKQMVEAKDEESADDAVIKSQLAIIDIYNLLEEIAHGSQSFRVRVVNGISCGCGGSTNNSGSSDLTGSTTTNDGSGVGGSYGKSGTDNGNWVLTF